MRTESKKKVDIWEIYRRKCSECGSENFEELNIFRYTTFKKKEQQKYRCKDCGHTWWQ